MTSSHSSRPSCTETGASGPPGSFIPDLPTTAQLIADYDLAAAKALCASLAEQDESSVTYIASAPLSITRFETPRATRGKYIVLDFMASSASINAARQMANAGLTGKSLVSTEQLENACGYLAAAWAYHLHRLDQKTTQNFDDITMEQARTYNRGTEIEKQNKYLNMGERGQTAAFLEVVDIMWLINEAEEENTYTPFYAEPSDWRNNDYWYDAEGNDEPTGIDWLDGVMAFNHWQVAFERSVAEPEEWGKVHIAVVNTVKATCSVRMPWAFTGSSSHGRLKAGRRDGRLARERVRIMGRVGARKCSQGTHKEDGPKLGKSGGWATISLRAVGRAWWQHIDMRVERWRLGGS